MPSLMEAAAAGAIPPEQAMMEEQAMMQAGEEEAQAANPESPLDPGEDLDSDIGFGLLANLIYGEEAEAQMENIFSAANPVPALAQVLAQAVDSVSVQMEDRGMPLSPRIWLAKGGAIDRAIDEIAEVAAGLGKQFPEKAQSAVFGEVIDALKLAGQAEKQQGQQQAGPMPPEEMGAPPMPQGSMPMGGGPMGAPPVPQGGMV